MSTTAAAVASSGFLIQFPATVRGSLGNWFHAAVRAGATTPGEVLVRVRTDCRGALTSPWATEGRRVNTLALLAAIDADPAGAEAYAAHCIWWAGIGDSERQGIKALRDETN